MAAGAKLQKSFQDYFRIPILLKAVGNTSQQKITHIATIFNQIERFPINEHQFSLDLPQYAISKQKIKRNPSLYERVVSDMRDRGNEESYKLLFLADQFDNDWSEFEIVYRVSFVILVYEGEQGGEGKGENVGKAYRKSSDSMTGPGDLNERISKINMRLKEKDKQLLGIIFLNDTLALSKSLLPTMKFTTIPPSLPLQQLSMFIDPWLHDLLPLIQQNLLQHILDSRYQQNSIIVFNRSQDKSQPKIMKKKKKFRCYKICGDLALMLHLYQFGYDSYQEADQQLRKVDDWMWVLGCVQGKLACMTSGEELRVKEGSVEKEVEWLISESFVFSKKIKHQSFQVQNLFKILKLLLHQDKQKFDDMIETTLSTSKGLTQQQKFLYYSYIGSLYSKAGMQRKRNYYYYKASLIIQTYKPQISQLLLKTIKSSRYIAEWEELNSKVIQKIIENEKYFCFDGEMHLELIEKCSGVLTGKEIEAVRDYLDYGGNFKEKVIQGNGEQILEVREFSILESDVKPKPNRLISDESPKKGSSSAIFVGWKKKLTYLYEENQPIIFKGTILNKLPFEIRVLVTIELSSLVPSNSPTSPLLPTPSFSLILPPLTPYKFQKPLCFPNPLLPHSPLTTITQIKFSIWNFTLYKTLQPEIHFQLYEKQPVFSIEVEGGEGFVDNEGKEKIRVEMEESSELGLRCRLKRGSNGVECDRVRVTCSVYYDVDVGFQENQFVLTRENNFCNIDWAKCEDNTPNITFKQSQQKEPSITINPTTNTLQLHLKRFKTTRNHIKKLQLNLDYIRQSTSKYQLNKQYIIEPRMINSVWAEILEISTPGYQAAVGNMRNLSVGEVEGFRQGWNVIEDWFLVRIGFRKEGVNLRPFRVWCVEGGEGKREGGERGGEEKKKGKKEKKKEGSSGAVVVGVNQVILSNSTEGEMWVKLKKAKVTLKQKHQILASTQANSQDQRLHIGQFIEPLTFQWQNIVNKNMQGFIHLTMKPSPLILCPKLQISIQVQRISTLPTDPQKSSPNSKMYTLTYTIASEQSSQIKPHKVSIKAYSEVQGQPQPTQNQPQPAQSSSTSNINILVKGKTKINRISTKPLPLLHLNQQDSSSKHQFSNPLVLKIIKEKVNDFVDKEKEKEKEKEEEVSVVVTIQFDQKEIGKWQQVVRLE